MYVVAIDVIHSLGFYTFGIKIDAIPGRINLATTLRSLMKGENRGFCFELCGQGHSTMPLMSIALFKYYYKYRMFIVRLNYNWLYFC